MSTTSERRSTQKRQDAEKAGLDFVDDRFGSSSFLQSAMDKIFPDHWSFMVGEISMYCFIVLLITGVYLPCSTTRRRPMSSTAGRTPPSTASTCRRPTSR